MRLAEMVEAFIRAQAARDAAEREVVAEMQTLGIDQAMLPDLKAVIHLADADTDSPSAWFDTDVKVGT